MKSEFGKGLTYCLGLFLCHAERDFGRRDGDYKMRAALWFNGAGDHLFDMVIPEKYSPRLVLKLRAFRKKVLGWRCAMGEGEATELDKSWAIQEAKDLLILIDKANGIKAIKGDWQ